MSKSDEDETSNGNQSNSQKREDIDGGGGTVGGSGGVSSGSGKTHRESGVVENGDESSHEDITQDELDVTHVGTLDTDDAGVTVLEEIERRGNGVRSVNTVDISKSESQVG